MSVYIDKLFTCLPNKNWRWKKSCHLFADSVNELHTFAKQIGLKRSWFQKNATLPHYDLTQTKRKRAILAGAVEMSDQELKSRIRKIVIGVG